MNVKEAVTVRRSIRGFRPEPVPRSTLAEIMKAALRAPSWGNTQPWKFTIVAGDALNQIKEEYVRLMRQGVPTKPDLQMPREWNEIQTSRYKGLGKALFTALGIGRQEQEKRLAYYTAMTRFFEAPYVAYLTLERGFNPYALMDGGIILQTIALLAVEQGLGTCFLARSVSYPAVVRKHGHIPPDQVLVMGIAVGYPIEDHPANRFRSQRGRAEEFIRWVDGG